MLPIGGLLFLFASSTSILELTVPTGAGYLTPDQVKQIFISEGVVPDVLPSFSPQGLLYLTYTGQLSDGTNAKVVLPGTSFARNDTVTVPQFSVDGVTGGPFVLAIVDPDAPSRTNPTISQIRHMLAPNITVSANRSSFAPRSLAVQNSTAAINEYLPPTPPPGSGPHRYVALLYAQPANFSLGNLDVWEISKFNISEFAAAAGLGEPLAGTFLTVEVPN